MSLIDNKIELCISVIDYLDFSLDIFDGIAGLDLKGDGLPGQGLDEDLHRLSATFDNSEVWSFAFTILRSCTIKSQCWTVGLVHILFAFFVKRYNKLEDVSQLVISRRIFSFTFECKICLKQALLTSVTNSSGTGTMYIYLKYFVNITYFLKSLFS